MAFDTKFSCIIVDDDEASKLLLEHYIKNCPFLEVTHTFTTGSDAYNFILSNPSVDLLFLDIMLPDFTGIELLKILKKPPKTILTTTRIDLGSEAFELEVLDYLVKPVSLPRFNKSIQKFLELKNKTPEPVVEIEKDEIFFRANKKILKLKLSDILYIEAYSEYVNIHTKTDKHLVNTSMSAIEEKLNKDFMRIHRSYIINIKKIELIEENSILMNNKLIPISKTYQDKLFQRLNFI